MRGQFADERRIRAEVGKGHRNIGFRAAEGGFQPLALHETEVVFGLKTEHDLTESYDSHIFTISLQFATMSPFIMKDPPTA